MIDITNICFLQDSSDIERRKILLNCCQYELHRNSKYKLDKLYFVFERAAIAERSNTQLGHIMKHLFLMEMRYRFNDVRACSMVKFLLLYSSEC